MLFRQRATRRSPKISILSTLFPCPSHSTHLFIYCRFAAVIFISDRKTYPFLLLLSKARTTHVGKKHMLAQLYVMNESINHVENLTSLYCENIKIIFSLRSLDHKANSLGFHSLSQLFTICKFLPFNYLSMLMAFINPSFLHFIFARGNFLNLFYKTFALYYG